MDGGSDIESETEEEYTESDITDEGELEQNVFGTGPIPKRRRGCRTRGDIREGINVSGERSGTHPPQDERLGTQPPQMNDQLLQELLKKEKAVEIRMMMLVVMKKIITNGLQK